MKAFYGTVLSAAALVAVSCSAAQVVERDVVIYGSSPAALTAAIEAQSLGKTAVIVSPETRIGGLTTGGLGQTDIGNKSAFGGLALQFYKDVATYYKDDANWKYENRSDYLPDGQCADTKGSDSMWTFEPSAALKILEGWEKKYALDIRRGEWLDRGKKVEVEGRGGQRRIVSFVTLGGTVYKGKMFVDATYEGDLMAAAGVSYTVGREANDVYGETISGIEKKLATHHQLEKGVDPYVVKGDPSSGLLPGIEPYDPEELDGAGDKRVQAYCFRMCLTDDPKNRIEFVKPEGYDPLNYELLLRNLEAIEEERFVQHAEDFWSYMPWINSRMPNRKTDTNNRTGVSTDFIGGNWAWPEASYEERRQILKAHLDWQMGLVWTLANDPRVPAPIRTEVAKWGTCRDEFQDGLGNGWQNQLYVREARRLVGDTVMTEHHCRGAQKVTRPVAMGAYGMDSHNVRRHVGADGFVHNEGNIEDYKGLDGNRFPPYGIDYGAIIPKKGECSNLFVPVCISASHMAFGSIRMEPVFFALGQSAGAAAALSIDANCSVQDLAYEKLQARLEAVGQVIAPKKPLKVLMIGNSFSICVLWEMPKIAADLKLPLDICSMYIGGCSLERHMKNVNAPETMPYAIKRSYVSTDIPEFPAKSNIPQMLVADKWDVVTIQQASHGSWLAKTYEPFGTELIDTVKRLAPQAEIYVQQTWSYTPWDKRLAQWGIDQNEMFDKLEAVYADFASRHGLKEIYTGKAVQRYRKELPVVYTEKSNDDDVCGTSAFELKDGKWQPKGDVFHFNARGNFLQGLVWTARLFDVDVTKSTYVPKCLADHPERAALMRRIATELR